MNISRTRSNRIAHQRGAILPVVLLLGMGLMYGVAGVVNLGFVQSDQAHAERKALEAAIATQYLIDEQFAELAKLGDSSGATIPFASGSTLFHDKPGARTSCFATANLAAASTEYIKHGRGLFGDGLNYASASGGYALGQMVPVDYSVGESVSGTDVQGSYLLYHLGREVNYLRFSGGDSGTHGDYLLFDRLGETDVDSLFAQFWVRAGIHSDGNFQYPLFSIVSASGADYVPEFQLILDSNNTTQRVYSVVNGASSAEQASASDTNRLDWLLVSLWVRTTPGNQRLWFQVQPRGEVTSNETSPTFMAAAAATLGSFEMRRGGEFMMGPIPAIAGGVTGDYLTASHYDLDIELAAARIWLEPQLAVAADTSTQAVAAAGQFATDTYNADNRRPGGLFSESSGVGLITNATMRREPDSYVTFDGEDALTPLVTSPDSIKAGGAGSSYLVDPDWQPLSGQPIFHSPGDVAPGIEIQVVGGNPDDGAGPSGDERNHGGPPASVQTYSLHSCGEDGYQSVTRKRRYTRGELAADEQVEWITE